MITLNLLKEQLSNFEWFNSLSTDIFGRFVVYVNKMNSEVFSNVPDVVDGKQTLCHFYPKSYNSMAENIPYQLHQDQLVSSWCKLVEQSSEQIVKDLFFEVHDGDDSITNFSQKYPDVFLKVKELYDLYGFDVIHNEMIEEDYQSTFL